jgi:hypothetical protein
MDALSKHETSSRVVALFCHVMPEGQGRAKGDSGDGYRS